MREGRFDEVKRLINIQSKSDPLLYWANRLAGADQMWDEGKKEECLREYEEFFQFYEDWQKKSEGHNGGQQGN